MTVRIFSESALIVSWVNTLLLGVGITIAFIVGDAHLIQRAGAAVVAVTGLFVIWQVRDELVMEKQLAKARARRLPPGETVIEKKATELQRKRDSSRESDLRRRRLLLISVIAGWLCIGELLHGFGDVLFSVASPAHH